MYVFESKQLIDFAQAKKMKEKGRGRRVNYAGVTIIVKVE